MHLSPSQWEALYSQGNNSNSAVSVSSGDPLTGSQDYGNTTFGDWFLGSSGAKEQATRQGQLDYAQWIRNEASAKAQRDWEEYMSSTQVQRAMKDVQAAGLNPWLALQSAGFGGSVPTGATATSAAGQAVGNSGSNGLASAGTAAIGLAALVKVIAKLIK